MGQLVVNGLALEASTRWSRSSAVILQHVQIVNFAQGQLLILGAFIASAAR